MGFLYGCGHWPGDTSQGCRVEGITLSSGILMAGFCCRSVSSTFIAQPLCPSPSISLFLFNSFCHSMLNSLTNLLSETIILPPPQCQALHAHTTIIHTRKHSHTLLHSVLLSFPRITCSLSFTYLLTQSYFSMVAFVLFISTKTKDSCARRTEGRRALESRKRSQP